MLSFFSFFLFLLEGGSSLFFEEGHFLEKSCTIGATYLGHLSLLLPSSFFSPSFLSLPLWQDFLVILIISYYYLYKLSGF